VRSEPYIEVEAGPGGAPARFEAPAEIVRAGAAQEVGPALAALEAALAAGRWLA
jgi:hypothetical protein